MPSNLDGKIIFKKTKFYSLSWLSKRELSRSQRLSSACFDAHRSAINSAHLALPAGRPISVYTVLDLQRAEEEEEEGGLEQLKDEENELVVKEEDGDEFEEFELLEMDELEEEANGKMSSSAIPRDLRMQCADCSRCPAPRLTMLRSCGHRICGECMAKGALTAASEEGLIHCSVRTFY